MKSATEYTAQLYEAALDAWLIAAALEDIAASLGYFSYHQMVFDRSTQQLTAG